MNNLEHTTMYAVAKLLWSFDFPDVGIDSSYHWDLISDSSRHKYYQRAVQIIDTVEPVWRARVEEYKQSVKPDFSDMEV